MRIQLKSLLSEQRYIVNEEDEESPLTIEEKREFLKQLKRFSEYSKTVNRTESLKEIVNGLSELIDMASRVALEETDDWFDKLSLQKDMKSLQDNKQLFEKTAKEVTILQNRLESVYQGIGNTLSKYYEL